MFRVVVLDLALESGLGFVVQIRDRAALEFLHQFEDDIFHPLLAQRADHAPFHLSDHTRDVRHVRLEITVLELPPVAEMPRGPGFTLFDPLQNALGLLAIPGALPEDERLVSPDVAASAPDFRVELFDVLREGAIELRILRVPQRDFEIVALFGKISCHRPLPSPRDRHEFHRPETRLPAAERLERKIDPALLSHLPLEDDLVHHILDVAAILVRHILHREDARVKTHYARAHLALWIDPSKAARAELEVVRELVEPGRRERNSAVVHHRHQPGAKHRLHEMLDHKIVQDLVEITILERALANRGIGCLREVVRERGIRNAQARGDAAQDRPLEIGEGVRARGRIERLEINARGKLMKRPRLRLDDRRVAVFHIVASELIARGRDEKTHLGRRDPLIDQDRLAHPVQLLERRDRRSHPRDAARLLGALR